jgi:hypothetical protein
MSAVLFTSEISMEHVTYCRPKYVRIDVDTLERYFGSAQLNQEPEQKGQGSGNSVPGGILV